MWRVLRAVATLLGFAGDPERLKGRFTGVLERSRSGLAWGPSWLRGWFQVWPAGSVDGGRTGLPFGKRRSLSPLEPRGFRISSHWPGCCQRSWGRPPGVSGFLVVPGPCSCLAAPFLQPPASQVRVTEPSAPASKCPCWPPTASWWTRPGRWDGPGCRPAATCRATPFNLAEIRPPTGE